MSTTTAATTSKKDGTATDVESDLIIGVSLPADSTNASTSLRNAQTDGFDFCTTSTSTTSTPRTDLLELRAKWWRQNVVGLVHDAITMDGLDFGHHMQLPAVILPELDADDCVATRAASLATATASSSSSSTLQFWIPVTLSRQGLERWQLLYQLVGRHARVGILLVLPALPTSMMTANGTNNNTNITPMMSSAATDLVAEQLQLLHVFLGEPVAAFALSTSLFLTNKKGYPTLAKSHQLLVSQLLQRIGRTVRVLLIGPGRHDVLKNAAAVGATGCLPYRQYLEHLRQQPLVKAACDSTEAKTETPYLDNLQRPLQPLADHLEYEIYENFEQDPVKYVRYQEAIYIALEDLLVHSQGQNGQNGQRQQVTVYVVGAGRGPLVSAVMMAFESLGQAHATSAASAQIAIVVVEKNPSAVAILKARAQADPQWQRYQQCLMIVHSDLRDLTLERCENSVADIVVSELLGSFGDNELSPECLDSFYGTPICRSDTVSIPTRYTSYLALANSAKLYAQAKQQALFPNEHESGVIGPVKAMETPYVVRTHACSQMCPEQACWSFDHPSSASPPLHNREVVLNMEPKNHVGCGYGNGYGLVDKQLDLTATAAAATPSLPWICTGLLGTFSADLYTGRNGQGTTQISIAPTNFSSGMFSWFPLYFPISEPLLVPAGASVRVYLWRRQSLEQAKVWYEWSIAVYRNAEMLSATPIHNPGGRSYHVSMK